MRTQSPLVHRLQIFRKILQPIAFSVLVCMSSTSCGLLSSASSNSYATSFIKGELTSAIDEDLDKVWKATQKIAEESQFNVKSARADAYSAVLKAEDAQLRKIDFILEKIDEDNTRVRIRVGLLGDAELSGKIFDSLAAKLRR